MSQLQNIAIGIAIASLFVLADAISAHWARSAQHLWIAVLIIIAPIAYIFFGLMTKRFPLGVVSGLVNTWIVVGTISVGVIFFHDALTTRQIVGLIFAVTSVYLLSV